MGHKSLMCQKWVLMWGVIVWGAYDRERCRERRWLGSLGVFSFCLRSTTSNCGPESTISFSCRDLQGIFRYSFLQRFPASLKDFLKQSVVFKTIPVLTYNVHIFQEACALVLSWQLGHPPVSFFTMFPVGILGFAAAAGVSTGTWPKGADQRVKADRAECYFWVN